MRSSDAAQALNAIFLIHSLKPPQGHLTDLSRSPGTWLHGWEGREESLETELCWSLSCILRELEFSKRTTGHLLLGWWASYALIFIHLLIALVRKKGQYLLTDISMTWLVDFWEDSSLANRGICAKHRESANTGNLSRRTICFTIALILFFDSCLKYQMLNARSSVH